MQWLHDLTGLSALNLKRILASIAIILVLWLVRRVVLRILWRRTEDPQSRYRWRKTTSYATVTLGILLVGRVWFAGIQSLATFLGLLSAGLAIALQDLVKSVAGWIFILWRRPFEVGDRIQVGNYRGDVIDVRFFKFSLMEIGNWVDADQSTGRVMHLPNSLILTDVIANYSKGFEYLWNEIAVLVTFESDWETAKDILERIAEKHTTHVTTAAEERLKEASKRYLIYYRTLTPTVYTSVRDSGVLLTIRYLIEPRRRRGSEQSIWEDILREFARHDTIDFAYPTTRFYRNPVEGKPGARAPLPGFPPSDPSAE